MPKIKKPSFDELINESLPILEKHAEIFLGEDGQDLCADAISKTLEEAWKAFPKYDSERPFLPWIKRILERNCKDERKSKETRDENRIAPMGDSARGQGDDDHDEDGFEVLVGRNTVFEWLPDEDGVSSLQSVEDYYRTLELTKKKDEYTREGVNLLDDFLKHPIPGQSAYDWYKDDHHWCVLLTWGDHWQFFEMQWDGPNEPPELDGMRKRLKGISKKTMAKKEGISMGAVYTATHRIKKKIQK